jgi:hypothetical protein
MRSLNRGFDTLEESMAHGVSFFFFSLSALSFLGFVLQLGLFDLESVRR